MSFIVSALTHQIRNHADPTYAREKDEIRALAQIGSMASIAGIVASIALFALGIASIGWVICPPLLIVSSALFYLSLNGYNASENLKNVGKHPAHYQCSFGFEKIFDYDKLRSGLLKNTYFFEWAVDGVLGALKSQGLAR